ncbi:hypothetical protein QTP70_015168 [Hemibagrus guttatus]|uniref:Uncharacterized protein n=1 Tax=Hemibagrus guttatus TaxID=175788 RepID=A0AAE0PQU7_9TELE|nr:hypothetical protein QTP70_015168 [Hemibagrus guttatus]
MADAPPVPRGLGGLRTRGTAVGGRLGHLRSLADRGLPPRPPDQARPTAQGAASAQNPRRCSQRWGLCHDSPEIRPREGAVARVLSRFWFQRAQIQNFPSSTDELVLRDCKCLHLASYTAE